MPVLLIDLNEKFKMFDIPSFNLPDKFFNPQNEYKLFSTSNVTRH